MDTRTTTIKDSWHTRASELAVWTFARLVNRTDAYGEYRPEHEIGREYTRRDGTKGTLGPQKTTRQQLSRSRLLRHFQARGRADVLGLHTANADNLGKWGGQDLDQHANDPVRAETNRLAALNWFGQLERLGFHPLLTNSNGAGGYHLRILLAKPIDAARLFWFFKLLTRDHQQLGFPKPPEQFPKQKDIRACKMKLGNWLRVPGRHHKRDFWSTVWNGSTWLAGEDAVDFMLSLAGDSPALIPEDIEWQYRIGVYMARLPNGSEGSGRDDVAFNLLAFMVRDLQLPDDYALEWAGRWDAGNSPPKGETRLREILGNVHTYGQRSYGSGLSGSNGQAASTPPAASSHQPAAVIIRQHLQAVYDPIFKRGDRIWSSKFGREVRRSEAIVGAETALVDALGEAVEVKRSEDQQPIRSSIPKVYHDWAPTAWADVLAALRDEADTAEVVESAAAEFRRHVAEAFFRQVRLGEVKNKVEIQVTRSLIEWCCVFAKNGPWAPIRSYLCWTRTGLDDPGVRIALRAGLFGAGQLAQRDLAELTQNKFCRLAEQYAVGVAERAGGHRVVELDPGFIRELLVKPAPDPLPESGDEGAG